MILLSLSIENNIYIDLSIVLEHKNLNCLFKHLLRLLEISIRINELV